MGVVQVVQFAAAVALTNCPGAPRLPFFAGRPNATAPAVEGLIPEPQDSVDAILARAPYRSLQLSLGVRMELSDMGQKIDVVGKAEQVVYSAFARCHARGVDLRVDVEAYGMCPRSPLPWFLMARSFSPIS